MTTRSPSFSRRRVLRLAGMGAASLAAPAILPARAFAQGAEIKTLKPGVISAAMMGEMPLTGERDGKIIGADAEMLQAIAAKLGIGIEWTVMGFPAVIEAVQSNRAEWFGGNFAWTPTRAKVIQLTDAVFFTGAYVIMKQDKIAKDSVTIADLNGHSIGTGTGFSVVPEMKKVPGITELKLYDNTDACLRDVIAGRLDFAVLDAPIIDYIIQQNPSFGLKQLPLVNDPGFPTLTSKFGAIWGIPPTNTDLFDAVNQGVRWLHKTGQMAPILAKYGITNTDYLVPKTPDPRIGVDRDEGGKPIGPFGHEPRDFSSFFVA